jgi:hypothetical protein
MPRYSCFFIWFVIFPASVLLTIALPGYAGDKALPFSIGEQIEYTVSWEMIKAGKIGIKVLPFTSVKGEKAYHFILDIKSNRYIDMLYKIRATYEGFTDAEFTRSLLYKKTQSGKNNRKVVVTFDAEAKQVTYSNFGKKKPPVKIPDNTFDPVSAFYKMRTLDFEKEKSLSFPVTDGKKSFIQKAEIIKTEQITINNKPLDTYLLIPSVDHFSGVFKKSKNPTIRVWVTADERKIPVRIKVKVFIGSVIFEIR